MMHIFRSFKCRGVRSSNKVTKLSKLPVHSKKTAGFADILAHTVDKMDKVGVFFRKKNALGETGLNTINMTIVY